SRGRVDGSVQPALTAMPISSKRETCSGRMVVPPGGELALLLVREVEHPVRWPSDGQDTLFVLTRCFRMERRAEGRWENGKGETGEGPKVKNGRGERGEVRDGAQLAAGSHRAAKQAVSSRHRSVE